MSRPADISTPLDWVAASSQEIIEVAPTGEEKKAMGNAFFRGHNCNFNPYGPDHRKDNFCEHFILKGNMPAQKIINKETQVTAFGSCFAKNITEHLSSLGFSTSKQRAPGIYISAMGEGLVNVHSLLQQFEWALTNVRPPENLWHGFDAKEFGYDEDVRQETRRIFLTTDVFIITLGLSEIWFDEKTGGIFWRAVPMKSYDPGRHKFRVCSFAETKEAIFKIYRLIRSEVPRAKIIFTLSPIPLVATFRNQACIVANAASKAILRAALDEFMRDDPHAADPDLHYFPAYEIVNELFPVRFLYDGRHPHPSIVPAVMKIFEAHFCETALTRAEAEASLKLARKMSADLCAEDIRLQAPPASAGVNA